MPPTVAPRLPPVPKPCETAPVSPWITVTSSGVTPSSSATIWANVVAVPWPWGEVPVSTVTRPEASTRTAPYSWPASAPVREGPVLAVSTKVEKPTPLADEELHGDD